MDEPAGSSRRTVGTAPFWVLMALVVVVALCGIVVGVDNVIYRDRIHSGVSIAGVDVGGMSTQEAVATVAAKVEEARRSPITLTDRGITFTVMPDDVGTAIDVEGAVSQAMAVTRYDDLLTDSSVRMELYFTHRDIPLRGWVDEARMQELLTRLGWKVNRTPTDSSLIVQDGAVEVTPSLDGRSIDAPALTARLTTLLITLHSTTLEVPMTVTSPGVRAEDNQAALERARTMIGAPIVLSSGDQVWTITAEQLADWMEFAVHDDQGTARLTPHLSAAKMAPFLDSIAAAVRTDPKNATFANDGTRAWVVPGANGRILDRTATAAAINAAASLPAGRVVEASLLTFSSTLPTEKATAMGIKDKLSSVTTKYNCPANRRTNVRITTEYATNVFLAPGEEYDFDKRIGPRTPQRGYKLAPGIGENKKMVVVYGGGICQVSTTMFNAVFFAGLAVTERWNHSLYIDHYPLGRDATVTDSGKNLRFVNDTGHYIWITGTSDGVSTTITIYGTDEGRKVTQKTRGRGGSYVEVTRKVTMPDGSIIHDDTFVSTW